MRIAMLLCCVALWLTHASAQHSLTFQPQKPHPGQSITIVYDPGGTPLLGKEDIEATAYLLENMNIPIAREISLKKTEGRYTGTIQTSDTTKAVFVSFRAQDTKDNNSDKGYYTFLYDNNGTPVEGAKLATGYVFYGTGGLWGMDRDADLGIRMMKDEFEDHPEAVSRFESDYLSLLSREATEDARNRLRQQLDQIARQPNASEEDLSVARMYEERTFKDTARASALKTRLQNSYPHGNWLKADKLNAYYKQTDLIKKEAIYEELVTSLPPKQQTDQSNYDYLAMDIAASYAAMGKIEKTQEYLNRIKNELIRATALNRVAWELTGGGIDKKPVDALKGKVFSAESLTLIKNLTTTLADRPEYFTPRQWKESLQSSYGSFQDTYATFLYQEKDYEGAYQREKDAVAFSPSVYAFAIFTDLTEKVKGKEAAQKALEQYAASGQFNAKMKDQLRSIYMPGHSDAEWEAYVNGLEKSSKEKMLKVVAGKMIKVPAHPFRLRDMNGNVVDMAALKGKTVVLDFWATWCGPCKASFPGMQKTVTRYRNDSAVVFLFIDTWETDKDREKRVKDFIEKNKYRFTVLYDVNKKSREDYAVMSQYKVDGIPTKFVIDPNGNIRFKAVGFGGDDEALVEELSDMIELARHAGR